MTKNTVDPNAVWSAFLANLKSRGVPLPVNYLMFLKGYILELPAILDKLLDEQLSLVTLCRAKIIFYNYAIVMGYPEDAVEAMLLELSIVQQDVVKKEFDLNCDLDDLATRKEKEMLQLITQLEAIASFPPVYFGDEPEILVMDEYFGISADALGEFYFGKVFRIRDLLLVDPGVIIRNPVKPLPKVTLKEE